MITAKQVLGLFQEGKSTISDYLASGGPGVGKRTGAVTAGIKKLQAELNQLSFDTEISVSAKDSTLYVVSPEESIEVENAIDAAGFSVVDTETMSSNKIFYYFR